MNTIVCYIHSHHLLTRVGPVIAAPWCVSLPLLTWELKLVLLVSHGAFRTILTHYGIPSPVCLCLTIHEISQVIRASYGLIVGLFIEVTSSKVKLQVSSTLELASPFNRNFIVPKLKRRAQTDYITRDNMITI